MSLPVLSLVRTSVNPVPLVPVGKQNRLAPPPAWLVVPLVLAQNERAIRMLPPQPLTIRPSFPV